MFFSPNFPYKTILDTLLDRHEFPQRAFGNTSKHGGYEKKRQENVHLEYREFSNMDNKLKNVQIISRQVFLPSHIRRLELQHSSTDGETRNQPTLGGSA